MNVKITEESVIFKITEEELNRLLGGNILEKKIPMGSSAFTMAVHPRFDECHENSQRDSLELIWVEAESYLALRTTMGDVQKLSAMGKSRDGLSAYVNGLHISLQVDVRKDSRDLLKREQ